MSKSQKKNLTLLNNFKQNLDIASILVAFSENMNFEEKYYSDFFCSIVVHITAINVKCEQSNFTQRRQDTQCDEIFFEVDWFNEICSTLSIMK